MIQNQRIPIGVMLVAGILSIPVVALTATKDTASFNSDTGHLFIKTLKAVNQQTAIVANDYAIAYQARCKAPISLGALKTAINSENGKRAVNLLSAQCSGDLNCAELSSGEYRHYMRLVTAGVPCDA